MKPILYNGWFWFGVLAGFAYLAYKAGAEVGYSRGYEEGFRAYRTYYEEEDL